jgi:ribosome biogenesis SPOUT family RNA methylase Rps3
MTTDTAVRVTRIVVQDKGACKTTLIDYDNPPTTTAVPLDQVPYLDFPELKFNLHESTQMPFRYVSDESGNPIMPEVSQQVPPQSRF